ncbi:patatin-like phospholipase family protein [Halosolutus halophilus]|uniref:patatin-like phospholipase family protein n=1 Tax=Halosolutus halophilus TaxID=1552990 RepID=UPI00223523FC|nr:patatin-like phospholipase family protein [Halosolutus halophilus]
MSADDSATLRKVAIACQGGGSHTAFTAGVLKRLLQEHGSSHRIAALSGTSGGALCAFVTWYKLRTRGPHQASAALDELWERVATSNPFEGIANAGVVLNAQLYDMGFPMWQTSPALNPVAAMGQDWLRRTITSFIDDTPLQELIIEPDAVPDPPLPPKLLISAVDANDGSFDVFSDRPELERPADGGSAENRLLREMSERLREESQPISVDAILASTAVPPLFDTVSLPASNDPSHAYWDGLLSQNPPVRNLLAGPEGKDQKPDEIWLIRINPTHQNGDFDSLEVIANRRNELAGNISLEQELYFIRKVNRWLNEGKFTEDMREQYKRVPVRQIQLDEGELDPPRQLRTASKIDRDHDFITDLKGLGYREADSFLRDVEAHTIVSATPS